MSRTNISSEDFIVPLNMDGLSGRMLRMPAPANKKAEVLFIYGQHSSLERWWGFMQYMNKYGAVTAPDLPGIGGMDSFYKIGKKPTIDNFADYLAAFVKMRYKNKQVVIVGMSLGFVIATRMLQRYPELKKNVQMLISLVGFAHADDFNFTQPRRLFYSTLVSILSHYIPAVFFRTVCLNSFVLRSTYHRTFQAKHKFAAARNAEEHKRFMDVEVWLWHHNDVRTHAMTTIEMLRLDNCKQRVDLPIWHVATDVDQYLDPHRVEQHLRVVFSDVHVMRSKLPHHAPSIIADEEAAAPLIPPKLRRILSKLP
jgi:pimeloyl-ACP methyl ester carboxylesterase